MQQNGGSQALLPPASGSDDTATIQAYLNAYQEVAAVMGETYTVKSPVTIPSETRLDLTGATVNGDITTPDPNTGNKTVFQLGRGPGAALVGGAIVGGGIAEIGVDVSGYNDGQIQHFLVAPKKISGCTIAGLQFRGGFRGRVEGTHITGCGVGILSPQPASDYLAAWGQVDFRSLWVEANTNEGVLLQSGNLLHFFGGNIEHNGTYGVRIDDTGATEIEAVIFEGVDFEQNGSYAAGVGLLVQAGLLSLVVIGGAFQGSAANGAQWKGFDIQTANAAVAHFIGHTMQGHAVRSTAAFNSLQTYLPLFEAAGDGLAGNSARFRAGVAGAAAEVYALGGDANIDLALTPLGTGKVTANGLLNASQGVYTKTKAGVPVDADFPYAPPDGTIVIDTTDSKIYTRIGGVWKGVAVA
ncbi:hypothetical protein KGP36_06995 [Patescibacteria group bacterium]|nr:hypothetical protein [Patescibacteria group bacterium]